MLKCKHELIVKEKEQIILQRVLEQRDLAKFKAENCFNEKQLKKIKDVQIVWSTVIKSRIIRNRCCSELFTTHLYKCNGLQCQDDAIVLL